MDKPTRMKQDDLKKQQDVLQKTAHDAYEKAYDGLDKIIIYTKGNHVLRDVLDLYMDQMDRSNELDGQISEISTLCIAKSKSTSLRNGSYIEFISKRFNAELCYTQQQTVSFDLAVSGMNKRNRIEMREAKTALTNAQRYWHLGMVSVFKIMPAHIQKRPGVKDAVKRYIDTVHNTYEIEKPSRMLRGSHFIQSPQRALFWS